MTTPITLVVDDDPPIYYMARITPVYCCNCKETVEVSEAFTVHPRRGGINMRPLKYNSNVQLYNLPIHKERATIIPIPFCAECASDTTLSNKPKAPPRKTPTAPPSWVGANSPRDYTVAGTIRKKEPKARAKSPRTVTLDDVD